MRSNTRKSSQRRHSSSGVQASIEVLEERRLLSAAPTLWADDAEGRLFTVNVGTGQVHVVGQMPAVMYDIAFDSHGNLYGVDGASGASHLWKINSSNASATEIGAVGAEVNSLVFSTNGTLYAAGSSLYTLSTSTGHGSVVGNGNLSGYSSAGDLAFDSSGNLYLSTTSNDLVRVSASTGAATRIGSMGFNEVYGMAYGPNGVLYGLSDATDQIFSINLSTGQGSLLSSFANQGVDGVNGSSFVTEAVPPAPSISILGRGVKIADGDVHPSTADDTSFGSDNLHSDVDHTFTIVNSTNSTLYLTNNPHVTLTGAGAADFKVVTEPASSVAPGKSTTFTVQFDPSSAGTFTATVAVPNTSAKDGHYNFEVSGSGIAAAPATTIYACDQDGDLYTVNPATGQTHSIGRMPTVMFDLAFSPTGVLYGVDDNDTLWRIDAANASASPVGFMGYDDDINSLVFSPGGTLYAAGSSLYRVNTNTGAATRIGALGNAFASDGDLAFDKYGRLVLTARNPYGPGSDYLVSLNLSTGQASYIGAIGITQVLGLAEGSDGVLYGMANGYDEIFAINPITGQGYDPVHFSGGNVYGVYGAAVDPV